MAIYTVSPSELDATLASAPANTVDTPHIINLTFINTYTVSNVTVKTALQNNPSKFVSLTILRCDDYGIDTSYMLNACTSLIAVDVSLCKIGNCTAMFSSCNNLRSVKIGLVVSSVNSSCNYMFQGCSSLTEIIGIRCAATRNPCYRMFQNCSSLKEINLSNFKVSYSESMFEGCSSLETIVLGDQTGVTTAVKMFKDCTSLEEIHGWSIPLTATMTDCFTNCDSLQAIYVPEVIPQESTWHAWDIKKDTANTRSDVTIYGTSGTPVTAQIPSSGTYSLEVSGMTDELLFSSTKAITSAHIQKMMQTQTPITGNTDALDPTKDNFVMLAKDRTAAKTNITTDVVEAGNLLPPTSAAVYAAIDANKNGGIPLGGWTSFENDTAPNDEWIQAGTTFDSDTYPELFLYLGGNTVPQRFDHSRLGDYEVIVLPTNSATAITMQYDGILIYQSNTAYINYVYINDVPIAFDQASSGDDSAITVAFKKNDKIWVSRHNQDLSKVAYYTHPMFIKATTTASSYTPSTAVQEIKDCTKDYVDAKNSYSTEETLTGGTWIDGKPIYRRTFHFNTMLIAGTPIYTVNVGQANFDTWIKTYYIGRRSNMTDIMTAYFPTWTANNYTGLKISVSSDEVMFVDYMVLEYTKKTTP